MKEKTAQNKLHDGDEGKAIFYKVEDGKDANGFTLSGEIAVLNGNNGEKKAGMRLRSLFLSIKFATPKPQGEFEAQACVPATNILWPFVEGLPIQWMQPLANPLYWQAGSKDLMQALKLKLTYF